MLNIVKICRKCSFARRYQPPTFDEENGDIVFNPKVLCGKADTALVMGDAIPEGCPYALEHELSMQGVEEEIIETLSR